MQEKTRLDNRTKTRNPFKEFTNHVVVKIFYKAAKSLYIEMRVCRKFIHSSISFLTLLVKTSKLILASLECESQTVSIEEEKGGSRAREHSTSRAKENDQCISRDDNRGEMNLDGEHSEWALGE